MLDIYAQYIPTTATFEYELPSQNEFSRRMGSYSAIYPYLVAEDSGSILGYAYAHRYAERAAYGWGRSYPFTSVRILLAVVLANGCTGPFWNYSGSRVCRPPTAW